MDAKVIASQIDKEVLATEVGYTVHYKNKAQEVFSAKLPECRAQIERRLRVSGVTHVTIGVCRNFVTIHPSGVSSVIFYDCFFLPPEEREIDVEKQAYDIICGEYMAAAGVCATTYDEYIACINRNDFKNSFDRHNAAGVRPVRAVAG